MAGSKLRFNERSSEAKVAGFKDRWIQIWLNPWMNESNIASSDPAILGANNLGTQRSLEVAIFASSEL